jgi:hypothetical protein
LFEVSTAKSTRAVTVSPSLQGYEPRFYDFEVWLLIYKLLMTVVATVFLPGTIAQVCGRLFARTPPRSWIPLAHAGSKPEKLLDTTFFPLLFL